MVKRVNLVDREALVTGKVLETIRIAGLDKMEFKEWLVERYGSNEKVREIIRDAVSGVSDKEATLYVPDRNPVSMITLPKTNVIKFLEKSFQKVLMEMQNTNFSFDTKTFDDWADEVDDSISNLLEALFYYMVRNSNAYKIEKSHSCWKYVLEVARRKFEMPLWGEDSYRVYILDTALMYVTAGPEFVKKSMLNDYENLGSLAYQLAIRIGVHFNESSVTDPDTFYKDEKGWNILFGTKIRKKGDVEFQDITFACTTNDNSNTVEMAVMFDNPNNKGMAEIVAIIVGRLDEAGLVEKYDELKVAPENPQIPTVVFTIKHKGIADYDFLDDIEELRKVCFESAIVIAM